jgi:hypothetical protein
MRASISEESSGIEFSRAERILALGMVIFLLVGGAWVFNRIQRIPARPNYHAIEQHYISSELQNEYWQAQNTLNAARAATERLRQELAVATTEYEFRREEFRVMNERGILDPAREKAYLDALAAFERLRREIGLAMAVEESAHERLRPLETQWKTLHTQIGEEHARRLRAFELQLFGLRLLYAVPVFLLALLLFLRLRKQNSNYLVFATALIGAGTLQLVYLVALYSWHLLRDIAQIAIAVIGTALCMFGIVLIRRYWLDPERVIRTRVRRGQCFSCGAAAEDNVYCPSCGEELQKRCLGCGANRPVKAAFCPHCRYQ